MHAAYYTVVNRIAGKRIPIESMAKSCGITIATTSMKQKSR